MLKQIAAEYESVTLCKNVQNCLESVQNLPLDSVLLETLKPLEQQMIGKGLLSLNGSFSFYPIWFLAETTRNVFLWRHGLSLDQAQYHEFWTDVHTLLEKRLEHLDRFDEANPFLNSLWGTTPVNPQTKEQEQEYIEAFIVQFKKISSHAHALSRVSSELCREAMNHRDLTRVLLPYVE
jgi:hypothetical protein